MNGHARQQHPQCCAPRISGESAKTAKSTWMAKHIPCETVAVFPRPHSARTTEWLRLQLWMQARGRTRAQLYTSPRAASRGAGTRRYERGRPWDLRSVTVQHSQDVLPA